MFLDTCAQVEDDVNIASSAAMQVKCTFYRFTNDIFVSCLKYRKLWIMGECVCCLPIFYKYIQRKFCVKKFIWLIFSWYLDLQISDKYLYQMVFFLLHSCCWLLSNFCSSVYSDYLVTVFFDIRTHFINFIPCTLQGNVFDMATYWCILCNICYEL